MRLRDLVTEAWRNVTSGAARPLIAALLAAVPAAGLVALETSSVNSMEASAGRFRSAQSAVFVLSAADAVAGNACDNLGSVTGISAAGALRATNRFVVPETTPATQVPLFEATRSFGRFLHIDLRRGVAIERDVAQAYRLDDNSLWHTMLGNLAVAGSYPFPNDGRNPQLQFAVVGFEHRARYDQCWIETWPFDPEKASVLYSALVSGGDAANATVTQLNPRNGGELAARESFRSRPSRWAFAVAFAWCLAATSGASRIRRLEFAFARHLGAGRQELALLTTSETLLWAAPVAAIGGLALAALAWGDQVTVSSAWHGAWVISAALIGTAAGSALGGAANREKDLFAFFKRRT